MRYLRQCSAANPSDIDVSSMTSILYFMPSIDTAVCKPVYIILTPHEYYMVLPALAINAASKPKLAA